MFDVINIEIINIKRVISPQERPEDVFNQIHYDYVISRTLDNIEIIDIEINNCNGIINIGYKLISE